MKNLTLFLLCTATSLPVFSQKIETESEIRALEQLEVKAVLQKDTAMLLTLWAEDLVVNAPDSKIYFAGKTTLDRPVLQRPRIAFTRDVEQIIIRGNTAFSMGSETVVSPNEKSNSQEVVKRRYTNIWMKQGKTWKLAVRHANAICP